MRCYSCKKAESAALVKTNAYTYETDCDSFASCLKHFRRSRCPFKRMAVLGLTPTFQSGILYIWD